MDFFADIDIQELRKRCEEAAEFCTRAAQAYQTLANGFRMVASCLKLVEENPLFTLNRSTFLAFYKAFEGWNNYLNCLVKQYRQDKSDSALEKLWL